MDVNVRLYKALPFNEGYLFPIGKASSNINIRPTFGPTKDRGKFVFIHFIRKIDRFIMRRTFTEEEIVVF